ncbi:MAG: ABC transporter ATP-binding protein [Rhabdochlamydiaceae bacterium]|nr:ABC transporter ATP-binding protein [Rhabdochlamydiaceae bacterium]
MILSACGIKKTYLASTPVDVLKGVNLEVPKASAIAIMGKSGSGKSTLLHILGTLEKPCSGTLTISGVSTATYPLPILRNRHIGFVFQSCHLLDDTTVLENVLMPAKIARTATHVGSPAHHRALYLLEAVGLKERAHFLAKNLSGGEKQRAAIARALCNDPELILADEPSGNLDHAHSLVIHQLLIDLTKKKGKSLIVVTHDEELAALCDAIYVLKSGILSLSSHNFSATD